MAPHRPGRHSSVRQHEPWRLVSEDHTSYQVAVEMATRANVTTAGRPLFGIRHSREPSSHTSVPPIMMASRVTPLLLIRRRPSIWQTCPTSTLGSTFLDQGLVEQSRASTAREAGHRRSAPVGTTFPPSFCARKA